MTVRLTHRDGLLRQSDYAPVAIGTGSRLLLLAGQTASALDGTVVADDLAGQVQASLRNVLVAVRSAGGSATGQVLETGPGAGGLRPPCR